MKNNRFNSKHQAQNLRKHVWGCLHCTAQYSTKRTICAECQREVHYFPSHSEYLRFRALQFEQRFDQISDLELQPSFPIVINGQLVCTYRADFKYCRDGEEIIEDVKGTTNEKYLDPVFKLKRKLVAAVYGIDIHLVKGD